MEAERARTAGELLVRIGRPEPLPEPDWPPFERLNAIENFRLELEAARARGWDFESAWRVARARAFVLLAEWDREQWIHAVIATKHAWHEAWHGRGEPFRLFKV